MAGISKHRHKNDAGSLQGSLQKVIENEKCMRKGMEYIENTRPF